MTTRSRSRPHAHGERKLLAGHDDLEGALRWSLSLSTPSLVDIDVDPSIETLY